MSVQLIWSDRSLVNASDLNMYNRSIYLNHKGKKISATQVQLSADRHTRSESTQSQHICCVGRQSH